MNTNADPKSFYRWTEIGSQMAFKEKQWYE